MPVLNPTKLINNRIDAILRYHVDAGTPRAQLDVSGGVDSAVMLMLLAEALGPNNVTAVYSSIHSSSESKLRAQMVSERAGVRLVTLDLAPVWSLICAEALRGLEGADYDLTEIKARDAADPQISGSLRSCLRAPVGRYMNRLTGGGIRHGTGNEDEDRWLRFYQKGGDGEVDTNPLAMLSKGEVFQLAVALGVPRDIVEALPTPDLWGIGEQHNDEEELSRISGVSWTYSRVDVNTGNYVRVGTIERLSRFLDHSFPAWFDGLCYINGGWLFANEKGESSISGPWELNLEALAAEAMPFFPGASTEQVQSWLESARKWERATRHKSNPNCPALGSRKDLIQGEILTDTLPEL